MTSSFERELSQALHAKPASGRSDACPDLPRLNRILSDPHASDEETQMHLLECGHCQTVLRRVAERERERRRWVWVVLASALTAVLLLAFWWAWQMRGTTSIPQAVEESLFALHAGRDPGALISNLLDESGATGFVESFASRGRWQDEIRVAISPESGVEGARRSAQLAYPRHGVLESTMRPPRFRLRPHDPSPAVEHECVLRDVSSRPIARLTPLSDTGAQDELTLTTDVELELDRDYLWSVAASRSGMQVGDPDSVAFRIVADEQVASVLAELPQTESPGVNTLLRAHALLSLQLYAEVVAELEQELDGVSPALERERALLLARAHAMLGNYQVAAVAFARSQ